MISIFGNYFTYSSKATQKIKPLIQTKQQLFHFNFRVILKETNRYFRILQIPTFAIYPINFCFTCFKGRFNRQRENSKCTSDQIISCQAQ